MKAARGVAVLLTVALMQAPAGLAWGQGAGAQATDDAGSRSCLLMGLRLAEATIEAFLSSPGGLLVQYPIGGDAMEQRVRDLVLSDLDTVDSLLGLDASATDAQRRAIGRGLAGAVDRCGDEYAELAAEIRGKLAALETGELLAAFLLALEDIALADTSGQGGGGPLTGTRRAGGGSGGGAGSYVTATQTVIFSVGGGGGFTTTTDDDVSPISP